MSKSSKDIKFEILNVSNLASLTEMTIEFWPDCDFNKEMKHWRKWINNTNHFVQLVVLDATYAGFIHVSVRNEYVEGADFDRVAYLEGIFIRPEFRKQGIAQQLFMNAERWAKAKGLRQMASDTEISNSVSQDFHQKIGFQEVNRIVCFVKNI